jgi:hypothetical protein
VPFLQACKRGIRRTKIIAVCLRYGVTDIHTNDKRISTYRGNNDVCLAGKLFDKRGIGVRADNRVNPKLLEFFCLFGIRTSTVNWNISAWGWARKRARTEPPM